MAKLLIFTIFSISLFARYNLDNYLDKGKEILKPFKKELMTGLKSAYKEGGAEHAIEKCSLLVPSSLNKNLQKLKSQGITLGRASHKNRNLHNVVPVWMRKFYQKIQNTPIDRSRPEVITLPNDEVAYIEPIYVKGLCLNCHGEKFSPDIQKVIKNKYPHDKATGFKLDDFRGVFWVRMPK